MVYFDSLPGSSLYAAIYGREDRQAGRIGEEVKEERMKIRRTLMVIIALLALAATAASVYLVFFHEPDMEAHTSVEHMKKNRMLQKVKFPEPPDGCFMTPPCPHKFKLQRLDPSWQVKELLWCRAALVTAMDNDTSTEWKQSPQIRNYNVPPPGALPVRRITPGFILSAWHYTPCCPCP